MKQEERAARLAGLIARGEAFREQFEAAYRWRWYRYSDLDAGLPLWKAEVLRFSGEVLGAGNAFYADVVSSLDRFSGRAPGTIFSALLSLLGKVGEELERLPAPAPLPKADFMEEMLARAEEMADRGNHAGAVILAGAVLDDFLRRLCSRHGLFCAENASLAVLNFRLLQRGVYGPEEHAETARRISLRDEAGHTGGKHVSAAEAGDMLVWLKDFCARRLTGAPA
jgi:hypothetical protein